MKYPLSLFVVLGCAFLLVACAPEPAPATESPAANAANTPPVRSFKPMDPNSVLFWGRFTAEIEELLAGMVDDFNESHPGMPVKMEYAGGYGEIFKKTMAGIHAGQLPALAMAYESMTSEYVAAGAVAHLGEYMRDPEIGLKAEDFDDLFPAVIETNKFEQFGGRMYSFPFAKSVLMMYYNKRVLAEAGHDVPPRTWDEFLQQCRDVKEKAGKQAYAMHVDCSTISGMIYSRGGEVYSDGAFQFDEDAALEVFRLHETMFKEGLAFQTQKGSYDDHVAFSNDEAAFLFRTSASRTGLGELLGWDTGRWGIAPLPQSDPENSTSVMFGPNIVVFAVGEEQERRAWEFVNWFTSTDNTVRFALGTGYLPIRKSAADDARMQEFWAEWPGNRAAYDMMAHAKPEPNVSGWQEVRGLVEQTIIAIASGVQSADNATQKLQQDTQRVVANQ